MKKKSYFNLKENHFILSEIGIICSLLFFIAATNINIGTEKDSVIINQNNLYPDIFVELPPVIPPKKIAPQKPMIFTEKPNDQIFETEIPEFPEFGNFDNRIPTPLESEPETSDLVSFVQEMPTIIGGQEELYSKINYPKFAQDLGIEGRVYVQFILDKQGNVTNPEIIRSVHPKLDEEVLRVIKLIKFSPGVQNGVLVREKMVQPVNFKLKR